MMPDEQTALMVMMDRELFDDDEDGYETEEEQQERYRS
jgi:hypothetical protein